MTRTIATALGVRTGGRHSVVPARAYADTRLKPMDICILGLIAITESADQIQRRDGWFQLSQGAMAVLGGMSRTTINRSLRVLEEAGYIRTREEKTDAGGTAAKLYAIVFDGSLERENDRWLGAVNSVSRVKKRKILPVHQAHTLCSSGAHPLFIRCTPLGQHIKNRRNVRCSYFKQGVCAKYKHPLFTTRTPPKNFRNVGCSEFKHHGIPWFRPHTRVDSFKFFRIRIE